MWEESGTGARGAVQGGGGGGERHLWRAGGRRWVLRLGRRWLGVPTRRLRSQIAVSRGTGPPRRTKVPTMMVPKRMNSKVRYFCVRDREGPLNRIAAHDGTSFFLRLPLPT